VRQTWVRRNSARQLSHAELTPDVKNTNTPTRFTEVAKRGADLDLNSAEVQSFVKLLQDRHTTLDPT